MELNELIKLKNIKAKKRIGRGIGSGKGGHTVGKGMKGQKSRKGHKISLGFEGGQVPLYKRLPQLGGFKNPTKRDIFSLNISAFNVFDKDTEISPKTLLKRGLVKRMPKGGIKILSKGPLKKKLIFSGFIFSEKAKQKIEKSGSKINA